MQNNKFLFLYDVIFLVVFTMQAYMVPYVVFQDRLPKEELIYNMKDIEFIVDIFWVVHILKTFCTPYIKDVDIKDKCWDIAKRYLGAFFWIDTISTVSSLLLDHNPGKIGLDEEASEDPSVHLQLYSLKLLRVFYFLRSIDIIKRLIDPIIGLANVKKQTRNMIISLLVLLYSLVYIMHLIACAWIYFGETQKELSWKDVSGQMSDEQ